MPCSGLPVGQELDLEVFGIEPRRLRALLEQEWRVDEVGESFAVLKLRHHAIDVSLPRRERKTGAGHRDFEVAADPVDVDRGGRAPPRLHHQRDAGRPRDRRARGPVRRPRRPRAAAAAPHLGTLRRGSAARAARHAVGRRASSSTPAPETVELCRSIPFEGLAPERVFDEWRKLSAQGQEDLAGLALPARHRLGAPLPGARSLGRLPPGPAVAPRGRRVDPHPPRHGRIRPRARIGRRLGGPGGGLRLPLPRLRQAGTTTHEGGRIRSLGHEAAGRAADALVPRAHDPPDGARRARWCPWCRITSSRASSSTPRRPTPRCGGWPTRSGASTAWPAWPAPTRGGRPPLPPDDEAAELAPGAGAVAGAGGPPADAARPRPSPDRARPPARPRASGRSSTAASRPSSTAPSPASRAGSTTWIGCSGTTSGPRRRRLGGPPK